MSKSEQLTPKFLLGADPELFLREASSGHIISAIGKIGGSKDVPMQAEGLPKGFCHQEDNVLVEYNIPPAKTRTEFTKFNQQMLAYLETKVGNQGWQLHTVASHVMDPSELEDPRALVFGCDPDFNVWTLDDNPRPECTDPLLRSAGGHIHIGMKLSTADKVMLGRMLDSTVGLWSVVNDPDSRRRELYGKAGAIRMKKYGLEYRTCSNFWLRSASLMDNVYVWAEEAVRRFHAKEFKVVEQYATDVIQTINTGNVAMAKDLLGLRQ
jgi:hypothetical protein